MIDDRYNRQELIEGWNQDHINQARIVIAGSGPLANHTAASLVALGMGCVEIYDDAMVGNDNDFLLFDAKSTDTKVKSLEDILAKINPVSKVKGVPLSLRYSNLMGIMGRPSIIIDTSNSVKVRRCLARYAQKTEVPMVLAAANGLVGELSITLPGQEVDGKDFSSYDGAQQSNIISGVLGGIITEEVRKIIMPLDDRDVNVSYLAYSLAAPRRFSSKVEGDCVRGNLSGKRALVIGAGGLGTFVIPELAMEGVGCIDIIDYDEVDSTNLNRQIFFHDSVGEYKSEALADKIRKMAPGIRVHPFVARLTEESLYFDAKKPDVILDCVDSFAVRAIINYFAVREGIPLVSGGTNPREGQVTVYRPGESSCLDCQLKVEKALAQQRKAASCRYAPDPSVIMTNHTIGSMMVGEAVKVLSDSYGEPVKRMLKYDSRAPSRGGLIGLATACECAKPEPEQWLEGLDAKYKDLPVEEE